MGRPFICGRFPDVSVIPRKDCFGIAFKLVWDVAVKALSIRKYWEVPYDTASFGLTMSGST